MQEYHDGWALWEDDDDDVRDGMSVMRRSCEGLLHLHDALGQVGRDLRQAFAAAVHDVVVAGAAGRTHRHLGGTSPGLRLNWTWRHTSTGVTHRGHNETSNIFSKKGVCLLVGVMCKRLQIVCHPFWDVLRQTALGFLIFPLNS